MGLSIFFPVIRLLIVYFRIPETPYWLLANGMTKEAEKVGKGIYKKKFVKAIISRINDVHVSWMKNQTLCGVCKTIFKNELVRRLVIKASYFFIVLQFTGICMLRDYSYYFYLRQGFSAINVSLMIQISGIVAVLSIIFGYMLFT
jgi:hypothetical protein